MGLNLESKITLDHATFERGMERVNESVKDSLKSFVLGAVGVGTIEEAFRRTVETASDLVNAANRLDITVEQVQLLKQAAKDAGTEMDTVATAMEKLNIARAKALGGDRAANVSFQALGVNRQDLLTKSAADLLMRQIGDKVKSTNIEQIAGPLREVLGRGAGEGIAFLKTDFEELSKKMQDTGAIMSGEVAAKLKAMGDQFELISRIAVAQLGPALLSLVQWAYKISLQGVGKLAGSAAYWGGEVGAAGGFWNAMKTHFVSGLDKTTAALAGAIDSLPGVKKFNEAMNKLKTSIDGPQKTAPDATADSDKLKAAGVAAMSDAEQPWVKSLKEFQAMLDKAAKDLDATKNPNYGAAGQVAGAARGGRIETDALVKVGNFLGTNTGLNSAASKMEAHASTTAKNTAGILQYSKLAAEQLSALKAGWGPVKNFSSMSDSGLGHLGGRWPNNGG